MHSVFMLDQTLCIYEKSMKLYFYHIGLSCTKILQMNRYLLNYWNHKVQFEFDIHQSS